jgi:hypothetical protein
MKLTKIRDFLRRDVKHFGVGKTIYDLSFRTINRCVYFKVLRAMKIESVHADYLDSDSQFRWQFFDEKQLCEFSETPEYYITEDNLRAFREKGDQCYGAMDGDRLTCYGWYSNKPTEAVDGLTLHFNSDYVYMYRGYTHPDYRGKRLHAIGMNRALREFLGRGSKGLVSYVESNNFGSLQSVYRMGYQDFGSVVVLKIRNHPFIHASRGCRQQGFLLSNEPALAIA